MSNTEKEDAIYYLEEMINFANGSVKEIEKTYPNFLNDFGHRIDSANKQYLEIIRTIKQQLGEENG